MTRAVGRMSVSRQPLDAILGTVAGLRVMRALLAHGGPLPVSRLVRDTRVSPNGVRDALRTLELAGVVDGLGAGRSRLYGARHDNPLVPSLAALFGTENRRFEQVLASIREAAALPEVLATWLFGSVARREDMMGSDIDIAVVIDAPEAALPRIGDAIRDRLAPSARALAFTPSIAALSPEDVRRLQADGAPLWADLLRDAWVLSGLGPRDLAGQ